jgi:3-hydroxyisobutyrate dehydrogenase-like beta-hydroxyacid dehydrogenase
MPKEQLGFIGLGKIGHLLALKILRGEYPMVVYDQLVDRMEILTGEGAEAATSPKDVASKANTIFLSLPTSPIVEEVCLGANGIAEGAGSDTLVVDFTSGNPTITARICSRLAEKGIKYIDVGVSGSANIMKGILGIMVGGDAEMFERVRPILMELGTDSTINHMGPIGSGHMTKALNNTLGAVHSAIACEILLTGVKAGLDPKKLIASFNASSGRSNATQNLDTTFFTDPSERPAGMDLYLSVNNVANACEIGRNSNSPMLISGLTHQIYLKIQDEMGPSAPGGVAEFFQRWMGVSVGGDA